MRTDVLATFHDFMEKILTKLFFLFRCPICKKKFISFSSTYGSEEEARSGLTYDVEGYPVLCCSYECSKEMNEEYFWM